MKRKFDEIFSPDIDNGNDKNKNDFNFRCKNNFTNSYNMQKNNVNNYFRFYARIF